MTSDRIHQVQQRLSERDLDALVVMLPENILLLTGFYVRIPGYGMALVPKEGEARLLVGSFDHHRARRTWAGPLEYLESTADRKNQPPGLLGLLGVGPSVRSRLGNFAREAGCEGGRVAFEGSFEQVSPPMLIEPNAIGDPTRELIRDTFDQATLVDFTSELEALRSVKTGDEIEAIKRASRAAELGHEAVWEEDLVGKSEVQVRSLIEAAVSERGHELDGVEYVRAVASVGSGPRLAIDGWAYPVASTRRIEQGDLVMIEMGTVVDGFWADTSLTVVAGGAGSAAQNLAERTIREAARAAFKAAVPGATGDDVDRAAREICEESGISGIYPHQTGHGVGFRWHETRPDLLAGSAVRLEEGMCVVVEPAFYTAEIKGGIRHEYNAVVSREGAMPFPDLEHPFGQG